MVKDSWSWDHGKVPIPDFFFVSIHKTHGSEWSNRAYKRVSRESLCGAFSCISLLLHAPISSWLLSLSHYFFSLLPPSFQTPSTESDQTVELKLVTNLILLSRPST